MRPRRKWRSCSSGQCARIFSFPSSFSYDLHQHAFSPAPVELAVKDLFPGAEIQFAVRDRDNDLASHDLSLHMGIGVVFTGIVMMVLIDWFMRREFFEPLFVIVMQAAFIVIDEYGCADVHGIDETKALANAALPEGLLHLRRDIHEPAPV